MRSTGTGHTESLILSKVQETYNWPFPGVQHNLTASLSAFLYLSMLSCLIPSPAHQSQISSSQICTAHSNTKKYKIVPLYLSVATSYQPSYHKITISEQLRTYGNHTSMAQFHVVFLLVLLLTVLSSPQDVILSWLQEIWKGSNCWKNESNLFMILKRNPSMHSCRTGDPNKPCP
jgi:hypothetical protein